MRNQRAVLKLENDGLWGHAGSRLWTLSGWSPVPNPLAHRARQSPKGTIHGPGHARGPSVTPPGEYQHVGLKS